MGTSARPAAEGELRRPPAMVIQAALAQLRRLLLMLLLLAGLGLGLAMVAAALQAGRDEARRADVLLVVAPAVPGEPLVGHAFELYRRGYAPRLLVAGAGRQQLEAALRERGLPPDALAPVSAPASLSIGGAVLAARSAGGDSALVAADAEELLLYLKVARDNGLRAYGSPPAGSGVELLDLLRAAVNYWGYVLLGRAPESAT